MLKERLKPKGTITPALLIIVAAFLTVIYSILFVFSLQFDYSNRQVSSEQALYIAEAGINYYKWHLAHDPDDYQDGTGKDGTYTHEYFDPQGNSIGSFELDITTPSAGSSVVTIRSTGWTKTHPNVRRTIIAQYGQPSFANYSFLSNASSWYGTNITVNGPVHSNNGIRMDGTNLSLVTSARDRYTCGSETGCSPPQTRPGVWGSGGDSGLWQYPVPAIDFNAISFDFTNMRTQAQNNGLYLAPSGSRGYHLIFNADGTFRVYRVTGTNYYTGYSAEEGCQNLHQRITSETLIGTYNVDQRPIVFAEDHLWVEGTIDGRVTVVAARFPIDSNAMNIWIRNNIVYETYDKTNSFGLIAQNDIYFVRDLPDNFRIDGAFMSQRGKIIRHGYLSSCGGTQQALKNSLTIFGSIISYNKSYWNFGNPPVSGFRTRTVTYDPNLLYFPPPYFPTTGEYRFISWEER
ncbi:MAG: hypothetical protein N2558_02890 [Patescibacteria group bacterium]|nr:hypothetical protein [Patescibacteria group bacterium]